MRFRNFGQSSFRRRSIIFDDKVISACTRKLSTHNALDRNVCTLKGGLKFFEGIIPATIVECKTSYKFLHQKRFFFRNTRVIVIIE